MLFRVHGAPCTWQGVGQPREGLPVGLGGRLEGSDGCGTPSDTRESSIPPLTSPGCAEIAGRVAAIDDCMGSAGLYRVLQVRLEQLGDVVDVQSPRGRAIVVEALQREATPQAVNTTMPLPVSSGQVHVAVGIGHDADRLTNVEWSSSKVSMMSSSTSGRRKPLEWLRSGSCGSPVEDEQREGGGEAEAEGVRGDLPSSIITVLVTYELVAGR